MKVEGILKIKHTLRPQLQVYTIRIYTSVCLVHDCIILVNLWLAGIIYSLIWLYVRFGPVFYSYLYIHIGHSNHVKLTCICDYLPLYHHVYFSNKHPLIRIIFFVANICHQNLTTTNKFTFHRQKKICLWK